MTITPDEHCRFTGLSGCGVVAFSMVRANSSGLWSVHNWKGSILEAGADGFDTCNDGVQFPVKHRVIYLVFGQFFAVDI
jgi:hypothetical protein